MNPSKPTKYLVAALVVFGAAMLLQAAWLRHTKSVTYDETFFLSCSLQTLHDGELDKRLCSLGVAPLPILLQYLPPLSLSGGEDRPDTWDGQPNDSRLISGPRLVSSIVVGLPLMLLVACWLYQRQGATAAALGAGLVAFSPSILAHSSLATTDACFALFGMLGLAAIAWYFQQPSRRRLVVMSLAIGAALAAKYSGVFLLPVVAFMYLPRMAALAGDENRSAWNQRVRFVLSRGAALALLIGLFCWGLHLFSFSGPLKNLPFEETPDHSPWVQILGRGPLGETIMRMAHENVWCPAPVKGVMLQWLHNRSGHCAYLAGQYSDFGWWYYFPCAFFMKSTPVELLLALGLVLLGASGLRGPLRAWKSLDVGLQVLIVAILVFTGLVMTAHINIGHRYIVILYPMLMIVGVDRLWTLLGKRPKALACCAGALLAGQAASCLFAGPHYLAYFNAFVGGPQRGWHYLADSNVDWGQDLPALREELERLGCRRAAVQYFGTTALEGYGVEADPLPDLPHPMEEYDVVAISVTSLRGLYFEGEDPFREFRQLTPLARAGYSIFLYDLTRPEVQQAMEQSTERLRAVSAEADSGKSE